MKRAVLLLSPVLSEPVSLTCLSLVWVQSKSASIKVLWWVTSGVGRWPRLLFGFTSDVRPTPKFYSHILLRARDGLNQRGLCLPEVFGLIEWFIV